ncbi:uncharacterized protein LOC132923516 isoform X2 [Rhopalosiphum padi]|uniref:uncharacterized protein LOC132923516 isoform X2 n=1 Tax=Rhopalosiphum padi TaxID=40932 RepID=UPI00298EBFA1|nr:uncharacterized protein LOC132923516 isoform X2 [Rhopalosiphum padi]
MVYKINKLLYVVILIHIHIFNVCPSTISFHHHKNDSYEEFDITTIYRITNMSLFNSNNETDGFMNDNFLTNFKESYSIEIHLRTNAIGMPLQFDKHLDIMSTNTKEITNFGSFQNNSQMAISYDPNSWIKNKISNLFVEGDERCYDMNYFRYHSDTTPNPDSMLKSENNLINCYDVFQYRFNDYCLQDYSYFDNQPNCTYFTFYWTPDKDQTCLTMTYYIYYLWKHEDIFSITIDMYDENNMDVIPSTELKTYNGVKNGINTLKITNIVFKKNEEYKLSFSINLTDAYIYHSVNDIVQFGLIRIAQCSNNDVYEDYDITTIYRITNMYILNSSSGGFMDDNFLDYFKGSYSIEIHLRTNSIGMPLQIYDGIHNISTNTKEIINLQSFQNNSQMSISYNSNHWITQSINNYNGYNEYCTKDIRYMDYTTVHLSSGKSLHNYCYEVFEYIFAYNYCSAFTSCTFFTFYWTPDKDQTCLTMTYYSYHRYDSKEFFITMDMYDKNNMVISSTELKKYNGVNTLKITNIAFKNNEKYKLSLQLKLQNMYYNQVGDYYFQFGLIRIAECSNDGEEDVRIVSANSSFGINPIPFNILGNRVVKRSLQYLNPCLNGGHFTELSNCICPPGFKGQFCETGCGLNSYGSDCKGVCSIRADKMCRGMLMCTSYGCTCPPGLTGPWCNKDCTLGTYGADCRQTCSSNCLDNTCDQYTGVCLHGCSAGYVLPYCREKYPYLINPPTLLSATYDRIIVELNFKENSITKYGEKILNIKYYQLFYKSLIEDTFRSFEIKPISNTTSEIISDLQPDTKYKIGVLLIADDGNFNDQDVVYGQYNTTCIQPQITDYNIKLMSGIQSINITWDIATSNRLECKITKYVLTLMSNQSQNQISDVHEILSNTESGHFLDNLLPGFQYNIKLTPSTSNGTLPSSPIYSFTTLMSKNDVQIKNISTKHENGKIKVYWILANSNQHYTTVHEPVTSIIRYKLKRILSCSTREIEQNWTSRIIYNHTNYEIFNIVPNSQYSIQVLIDVNDKNTTQQGNMIDVLTPASNPKTEPILDPEHPIYITNSSIFVQWKVDSKNCSKLNGFLSQFYIELKDTVDDILQVRETKNNYISFNDLKANSTYELKVFIKTHIGYNPEHFLLVNFMTKFGNLKAIEDLVVYKKSLKKRMVGFRWSYSQNTKLDGFIVSFNESNFIISPQKCSAWPEYYCHTFYNLNPSSNYTFKIKPKSIDYPEGGKVSSIYFNSVDGLPDSPMNIKTTEIGNTSISVQWDIPWIFNGELKMFIINVEEIASVDMETCCISIAPTEILVYEELPTYNHTITGLQPGSTYSIGVLTVSKSSWYSSPSRLPVTTIEEM